MPENSEDAVPGAAGHVLGLITLDDIDASDEPAAANVTVDDDRFQVIDYPADDPRPWLTLKPGVTLDFEAENADGDPTIDLKLTVTDGNGGSASTTVTVTVEDVNEAPSAPALDAADGALTVAENDEAGGNIGTLSSSDPEGGKVTFSVDDPHFEIETLGDTAVLKYKAGAGIDYEGEKVVDGKLTIMLTATDGDGLVSEAKPVEITVTNVNEAPTIMFDGDAETPDGAPAKSTVTEHAGGGEFEPVPVGEVKVSDPDGEMLTSEHIKVDDDRFGLMTDSLGGIWLMLNEGLDADGEGGGTVTVKLTVTDGGELTGEVEAVITVEGVNDAPTIELRKSTEATGEISENATGAVYEIDADDDEDGEIGADDITIDDPRFEVRGDSGSLQVFLKDEVDYEEVKSIPIVATVTDSGDATATASATVTILNANDAPTASGELPPVTGEAGEALGNDKGVSISLTGVFSDADGDRLDYAASGGPSWLQVAFQSGTAEDGSRTIDALFTGEPPAGTADSYTVTITATDTDGAKAEASVKVVIDDGNDDITAVDLLDGDGKVTVEADVDENDDSGVVLGGIRVTDPDDPKHPNGMHKIDILKMGEDPAKPDAEEDERFEAKDGRLLLKAGMSLDKEEEGGAVDVIIRAVDMGGKTNAKGDKFTGSVAHKVVTVVIADKNDAPKANPPIGNWWVTTEDDLESDEIEKGGWLTFGLDTDGADAAFTDPDGDTLTYTLEGPSFLEINQRTGQITNTKGGVPVRGVHTLTVTASDGKGGTAETSFKLAIGFSDPGTNFTEDNEEPEIRVTSNVDYVENSGNRRVATFTVTDEDNDLEHHPFALDSVRITAVVNADNGSDPLNQSGDDFSQSAGYAAAFRLSEPVKNGDTWTYELWVRDTNSSPRVDTTAILNPDPATGTGVDEITVTVTASDGQDTVTEDIDIDIEDANDLPTAPAALPVAGGGVYGDRSNVVRQSEPLKEILYIKLEDIWSDAEDDPDDLTFGASASGGWIKILHGPAEWGDIKDGRDGDSGTDDDVGWNVADLDDDRTDDQTAVVIGTDENAPDDGEQVVIIELDRTGGNNGQGEKGSFTLTATDKDGGTGTKTYTITPTDENLFPSADAVEISGSAREDATLRATFNDDKDPDLRGDAEPVLVLYEWWRSADAVVEDTDMQITEGTSSTYRLKQTDVGNYVTARVKYYEVVDGQIVRFEPSTDLDNDAAGIQGNLATTSRMVSNTPDAPTGSITILADNNALTVAGSGLSFTDADLGGAVADDDVTITWQVSDNGRGGWTDVTSAAGVVSDNGDVTGGTLTLAGGGIGNGKYYRAVAFYDPDDDAGAGTEMESIYSGAVRVSNINNGPSGTPVQPTPAPTISGSAFPGGTLTVNAPGATVSVQWQVQVRTTDGSTTNWVDLAGATGSSLALTQANAGQTLRAVVSYEGTNGVTAIVAPAAQNQSVGGTISGTGAVPVRLKDYDIEATVTGTGHGPDLNGDQPGDAAGHNLSLTETVDLRILFQDPDSARLYFTATAVSNSNLGANNGHGGAGGLLVFDESAGGVLTFDARTGELTFNSDVYRGHDGTGTDGMGNVLSLSINANDTPADGGNDSAEDPTVNVRINVAPTDIWFAAAADGLGSVAEGTTSVTVPELRGTAMASEPAGLLIAHLNVQDENLRTHKFGTHKVMVLDDDRFMIKHTGYTGLPTSRDGDGDGSTWELRLKPGVKLDYEAESADGNPNIVLTLTATDESGDGLSTPTTAATGGPITLTVTVTNDTSDDIEAPSPTNVPGLQDNEGDADPDERIDNDDGDGDTDGGANQSMDAMMMSTLDDGLF